MPVSLRLATLAVLLALALGCGKRDREQVSAPPDPAPATPPVKAQPAPDPAPPKPAGPKPPEAKAEPKDEGPKPIVFRGPGVRGYDLKNIAPTADVKAEPGRLVDETASQSVAFDQPNVSVQVLADGSLVVFSYGRLRVWDPVKGAQVAEVAVGDAGYKQFAPVRGGQSLAAIGRRDGRDFLAVYDLRAGKVLWEHPNWPQATMRQISTSFDGKRLYLSLVASKQPVPGVVVYDALTGKELDRSNETDSFGVLRVAFPDNSRVLMAGDGSNFDPSMLSVWEGGKGPQREVATLDRKRAVWTTHALAVSPSGRLLAWGSGQRMLVLSSETGEVRHDVRLATTPNGVVFSPDDRFLAWRIEAGGSGPHERAYLFDLAANKVVFQVKSKEDRGVATAGFTADGTGFLVGIVNHVYRFDLPAKK